MAGYGDDSEAVDLMIDLARFELIWAGLSLAFFLLLPLLLRRKLSFGRRFGYTVIFWIAQIIYPFVKGPAIDLFGRPGSSVIVNASKAPLVFHGVTFPAGSRAEYEHLGWGFWRVKLVGVTATKPVKLGPLDITGLSVSGLYEGAGTVASVALVRPQVIDGWPCEANVLLELTSAAPRLATCDLDSPRTLGNLTWPVGTSVENWDERGWSLSWHGSEPYAKALGFSVYAMSATYGASLQLADWTAQAIEQDVKVGDYAFDSGLRLRMTWESPDEVRIEGHGKDAKTGADLRCALMRIQDRAVRPCERNTEAQPASASAAAPAGNSEE